MPGRKPLAAPCDLAFLYDGGLKGFYTCVYESVYSRQLPLAVWPEQEAQPSLLPQRYITTDEEKAGRVRAAIPKKISPRAKELVECVFLSCMPDKELPMLRFLLKGFQAGSCITNRMQDADVAALLKAERHLGGEAHLLKGFIRFEDVNGHLIAAIRPKNFVLPFLAEHFVQRFSREDFLIYDRTHHAALLYERGVANILPLEALPAHETSAEEAMYQALWKRFYNTIAIEARENPRCRMSHMPKRYWAEMTEMRELL